MTAVQRLVDRARRRLRVIESLEVAAIALPSAGWGMLAWIVVSRLFFSPKLPEAFSSMSMALAIGFALFMAHAALLFTRRGWPTAASAAAQLDERLRLESRMSTAYAMQGKRDDFSMAAVADAERVARDPRLDERLRQSFACRFGPEWRLSGITLVVVLAAWFLVPNWSADAAKKNSQGRSETTSAAQAAEAEQKLSNTIEIAKEVASLDESIQKAIEASQQLLERAKQQPESAAEREAQAFQQRALLEAALEKASQSDKFEEAEAMKNALAQMSIPDGDERELMEALKRGDYEAAKIAAEKLAAKTQSSNAAEAAAAKAALERVAAAMNKEGSPSSSSMKQLEKALANAGLDPKLASNPQALQQALMASKNLSPEDKLKLSKMMKNASQACKQCNSLGNAAKEAANGRPGNLMDMFKKSSNASGQCQSLTNALANCRSPGGRKAGSSKAEPTLADARMTDPKEFKTDEVLSASQNLDAEPIARDFVQGSSNSTEESTRKLTAIQQQVEAGLEEGSDEDPVPAPLREAHQKYFTQWKKKIDAAKTAPAVPPTPTAPAAPPASRPGTP
ncbi:MAG: hypothetical protein K8R92_03850 [Planctomycetes bacterium]|nr:hypothetical protein [Planctomycetota bacterium]